MAQSREDDSYARPVRRLLIAVLLIFLMSLTLIWRIDNPRMERVRAEITDRFVPRFEWATRPFAGMARMAENFQSYQRLYDQNQELRQELQDMRVWYEAALQLEEENARLRDLANLQLDPELTFVSGVVMTDSGSPFRRSVLINIGARDGILDGWATMDGLGLVGRISGVGQSTSRVILVTDSNSQIPVTVQPSGTQALLVGDNSPAPALEFIEDIDDLTPGDRVVTSGDGGLFPPGLLVGQIALTTDGRYRVRLSADLSRLNFLRVMRSHPGSTINDPGGLIGPPWPPEGYDPTATALPPTQTPVPRGTPPESVLETLQEPISEVTQ